MAKLTKRDRDILELKDTIEKKKKELADLRVFKPKTNLVLPFGDKNINLNVLDKNALLVLLAQLVAVVPNLQSVGVTDIPEYGNFSVEDWVHDIKGKYLLANIRLEEQKLKTVEDKLDGLLSEDVKKDREFDSLKASLT